VDSTRFLRLSLPIILAPSSEIVRRMSTTATDDQADELRVFAVLLRPATCEERVIASVKYFVVLRSDRFVLGSRYFRENATASDIFNPTPNYLICPQVMGNVRDVPASETRHITGPLRNRAFDPEPKLAVPVPGPVSALIGALTIWLVDERQLRHGYYRHAAGSVYVIFRLRWPARWVGG
jgi:hypothetical protein